MKDFWICNFVSAAVIVCSFAAAAACSFPADPAAAAAGAAYILSCIAIYGRLGAAVLSGSRTTLWTLQLVILKLVLLLGAAYVLAGLEPIRFWSALAGGFCFMPAALLYASRLPAEDESQQ